MAEILSIKNMSGKDWAAAVGFVVFAQAAGLIGSLFTAPAIDTWYAALVRPAFAPPNWVFGPVWTTLFVLMGVAAFLVWRNYFLIRANKKIVLVAMILFVGQLVLNTLWSVIFFGLQSPGWALVEIFFLWLAIVATIITFARVSRPAAWLLSPYIAWVTFAAYLNYSIWLLN